MGRLVRLGINLAPCKPRAIHSYCNIMPGITLAYSNIHAIDLKYKPNWIRVGADGLNFTVWTESIQTKTSITIMSQYSKHRWKIIFDHLLYHIFTCGYAPG